MSFNIYVYGFLINIDQVFLEIARSSTLNNKIKYESSFGYNGRSLLLKSCFFFNIRKQAKYYNNVNLLKTNLFSKFSTKQSNFLDKCIYVKKHSPKHALTSNLLDYYLPSNIESDIKFYLISIIQNTVLPR